MDREVSAAGGVVALAAADGSLAAYGGGASAAAGGSSAAYGGPSATAAVLWSSSALPHEVQRPPGLPQGDDRGIPQGGSTMIHDAGPRGGVILPEGPTMTQDGIARPEVCLTPRRAQQVNPFWSPERRAEALRVHGGVDPMPAVTDGALLPGGPGSGQKSEQGGRSGSYVEMDPVELFRLRCLREAEEKFTRGMARMNAGEDGSASGSYHTATASGGVLGDMGVHGQVKVDFPLYNINIRQWIRGCRWGLVLAWINVLFKFRMILGPWVLLIELVQMVDSRLRPLGHLM